MNSKPHVLVDGLAAGAGGGIGRLTSQFLERLPSSSEFDVFDWSVVLPKGTHLEEGLKDAKVRLIIVDPPRTNISTYLLWYPRIIAKAQADIALFFSEESASCTKASKSVVVVTEIRPCAPAALRRGRYQSVKNYISDCWHLWHMRRNLKRADRMVSISHATKRDTIKTYGIDSQKIDVVWPGVDGIFHSAPSRTNDEIRAEVGFKEGYFLAICRFLDRENFRYLLENYSLAVRRGVKKGLCICGGNSKTRESVESLISELGIEKDAKTLGWVRDDVLRDLYYAADAYLDATTFEGFGLQVLEAMTCGTAVIHGNVSSLPEVSEDAALLYDVSSPAGLADKIVYFSNDAELKNNLGLAGRRRSGLFSQDKWCEGIMSTLKAASQS